MIELDKKTQKLYDSEMVKYEELLSNIKSNYFEARNKFISNSFVKSNCFREECYFSFLIQFKDFLGLLAFSKNDNSVISKLNDLGFSSKLSNYMSDINLIEYEIKRLEKIDGLLIFPYNYLDICINILTTKFMIVAMDKFIGSDYNGIETNKLHIDFINRNRRRNYIYLKKPKPFKSEFEFLMNKQLDLLENNAVEFELDNHELVTLISKSLNGNYGFLKNSLIFHTDGFKKRQVYIELFPLLKLIVKDRELKSEVEFFENHSEANYNNNYNLYKITKVRDLLNLK